MKQIGTTQDGHILAKMSFQEWDALAELIAAVQREPLTMMHFGATAHLDDVDIETALGAVKEFATNRDLMNRAIDRLTQIMETWDRSDQAKENDAKEAMSHNSA